MLRAHVHRRRSCHPGAAAQRERDVKTGDDARTALGSAGVHQDAGSRLDGELAHHVLIGGVDAHGVADAILQQLDGKLAGLFPVGDGIEAQNSGELLVGQRPGIAHAVLLANKHTSALGDRDTSRLRDRLRAVAHKLGVME